MADPKATPALHLAPVIPLRLVPAKRRLRKRRQAPAEITDAGLQHRVRVAEAMLDDIFQRVCRLRNYLGRS